MAYSVNYDDKRLTAVEDDRKVELTEAEKSYADRIAESEKFYTDAQNKIGVQDANGNWNEGSWADTQTDLQNEQTDFAIQQIEQNKAQAKKDYTKEQAGAYVDWQKQSDPYGVNAEKKASSGMLGTGYNESSQVAIYNQYQNRVATARASYDLVIQNYNNKITEARLANSSALAEIAAQAMEKGLELAIQGLAHKDQLLSSKATEIAAINSRYDTKWQNVLDQINNEKAIELQERQVKIQEEQWAAEKQALEDAKIARDNADNKGTSYSRNTYVKKATNDEIKQQTNTTKKKWNDAISNIKNGKIKTYEQAKSLLSSLGISMDVPLLTNIAWVVAKRNGEQGSEFDGVANYGEYLKMYCTIAIQSQM